MSVVKTVAHALTANADLSALRILALLVFVVQMDALVLIASAVLDAQETKSLLLESLPLNSRPWHGGTDSRKLSFLTSLVSE